MAFKEKKKEWKEEHPLKMKEKPVLTPQKVIETINEMFEEAIVVTDVGQHQMFTTQYLELTEKKQLLTSGGLGTMGYGFPGAIGAQLGRHTGHCDFRRWWYADEYTGICDCSRAGTSSHFMRV